MKHLLTNTERETAKQFPIRSTPLAAGAEKRGALALHDAPSAIDRALQATVDWTQSAPDAYVSGEAVMRTEARVPDRKSVV